MSMDKSILTNIASCYQKNNPSQISPLKIQGIVPGGIIFLM